MTILVSASFSDRERNLETDWPDGVSLPRWGETMWFFNKPYVIADVAWLFEKLDEVGNQMLTYNIKLSDKSEDLLEENGCKKDCPFCNPVK